MVRRAPVAVSNLVIDLTPGLVYHCRVAASNALGVVHGNDVPLGSPTLALNGAATVTNECHAAFTDPGAMATGAPLAIAGGGRHSLALKSDGTVAAWGDNGVGQTNIPVGLSNVVAVAGGFYHSLALKSDGTVAAWGAGTVDTGSFPDAGQSIIPAGLSTLIVTVSGTFNTNNSPGTYSLTYNVSNPLGGSATATRTVVVQDTTPPGITILGSNPLMILTNTPFIDPGATALDACAGNVGVSTNGTVNVVVPGTYAVAYTADDGNGHSTTNTRLVLVQFTSTNPPALTAPVPASNGVMQLGFTNLSGASFTVLGSSDVSVPFTNWTNLGPAFEVPPGSGQFHFTDPQATNLPQRFYLIRSP